MSAGWLESRRRGKWEQEEGRRQQEVRWRVVRICLTERLLSYRFDNHSCTVNGFEQEVGRRDQKVRRREQGVGRREQEEGRRE